MPDAGACLSKLACMALRVVPWRYGDTRSMLSNLLATFKVLNRIKLANFLKRELQRRSRNPSPEGFPYHAILDVVNACNLKCPYCPTGRRQTSGRSERLIDVDRVGTFLDRYGKYLIAVDLFNWGESLLHPRIHEIVDLIHQHNIFQQISTNLNIKDKAVLRKVCDAGVDHLIVSISGITQDVYEKYHRNGDLSLVMENLEFIVNYRKQMSRSNPLIEVKFLTFKYNLDQVQEARRVVGEIGVDIFRSHIAGGAKEDIIERNEDKRRFLYQGAGPSCSQLWTTIVLNSDGGIAPCCFLYFKNDDFADLETFTGSNQKYLEARSLFNVGASSALDKNLSHPCLKCSFVHRQRHLASYLAANPNAKQGHRTGGP